MEGTVSGIAAGKLPAPLNSQKRDSRGDSVFKKWSTLGYSIDMLLLHARPELIFAFFRRGTGDHEITFHPVHKEVDL